MALAFSLLGAAALVISGTAQVIWGIHAQSDIVRSRQQLVAQEAAKTVSAFIQEKLGALAITAGVMDLTGAAPPQRMIALESLLGLQPALRQVILLDVHGDVLASASRLSHAASRPFQERVSRDAAAWLAGHADYHGPVYVDHATSEPMMVLAVAVQDDLGGLRGSFAAEMNLKFMWDLINRLDLGPGGRAYVVDKEGMLIADRDMGRVLNGDNMLSLRPVAAFAGAARNAQLPPAQLYTGITGARVMGTYVPLGTPDWAVVTEVAASSAFHTVIAAALMSAGLTVALALLFGFAGMSVARHLTVPITRLAEAAARISAGETAVRADASGPREISALAVAFNTMTAQLSRTVESLEEGVRERTAQLESSNREMEAFMYSVSHDLRAPLRAIHGFSSILLSDFSDALPADAGRFLRHILDNTQSMTALINVLLELSRTGRQPMHRQTVSPARIVPEVIQGFAEERAGRALEITVGDLPDCQGDPTLLRQVWANLIANAVKFTRGRAEAKVEIGWVRQDGTGSYYVRDNGIGFDMKYADRLFSVFQRLHGSESFEGTGAGLAIVQRIVHRHGGRIWAESAPDAGACFYFTV